MKGGDLQLDAFSVDVRDLLSKTVASLYSHLVTRPTGRAVRMAIEAQLDELRTPVVSFVDFSSVSVLDYSCADEVVAKLLLGLREGAGNRRDVLVSFRGLRPFHREPIEEVLARHDLHAVVGDASRTFEILGTISDPARALWAAVESAGRVSGARVADLLGAPGIEPGALAELIEARSLFRHPHRGDLYALSELGRLLDDRPAASGPRTTSDHPDEPQPRG